MKQSPVERPSFVELLPLLDSMLRQAQGPATATQLAATTTQQAVTATQQAATATQQAVTATQQAATATQQAATATPCYTTPLQKGECQRGGERGHLEGLELEQKQGLGQGQGQGQEREREQEQGHGQGPPACPVPVPNLDRVRLSASLVSVEGQAAVLKCNLPSARKVTGTFTLIDILPQDDCPPPLPTPAGQAAGPQG